MARMKRNVGDQVSGRIGNMVFYQMNDKSYIRAAPTKKRESWSGRLPEPQNLQVERVEGDAQTIKVSWQNDPHLRADRLKAELMMIRLC